MGENTSKYTLTLLKIDYNFEKKRLKIKLFDGSIIEYINVPVKLYENMLFSPSPSKFLLENIADFYMSKLIR